MRRDEIETARDSRHFLITKIKNTFVNRTNEFITVLIRSNEQTVIQTNRIRGCETLRLNEIRKIKKG